jgi:hypothetical protein
VVTLIPMIARAAMRAALVASIPMIAWVTRIATLVPVPARCRLGALTLNVLRRTAEAAQLLAQRFDLALVGGLLALGQFEQLQHFVELIERLAERRDDFHHFIDGLVNRLGMRRLGGTRGRRWRTVFARARGFRSARFVPCLGGLVGDFDFGR